MHNVQVMWQRLVKGHIKNTSHSRFIHHIQGSAVNFFLSQWHNWHNRSWTSFSDQLIFETVSHPCKLSILLYALMQSVLQMSHEQEEIVIKYKNHKSWTSVEAIWLLGYLRVICATEVPCLVPFGPGRGSWGQCWGVGGIHTHPHTCAPLSHAVYNMEEMIHC